MPNKTIEQLQRDVAVAAQQMRTDHEIPEREVEETRWQLAGTLEELRDRMTPGRVVDELVDYTRDGPVAEFLRNLGREVREIRCRSF